MVCCLQVAGKAIEGEEPEVLPPGASSRDAPAAGTPVTPAMRPAERAGLSAAAASAPSRMCMSASTPASVYQRSSPGMPSGRTDHTGASNLLNDLQKALALGCPNVLSLPYINCGLSGRCIMKLVQFMLSLVQDEL
jgi:hypothetical protein